MYLIDTNIFLEILLSQEKSQKCKEILINYGMESYISDFSLHSIGVILFRYNKEGIFNLFLKDIVSKIGIISLAKTLYENLPEVKRKYGLDFDDAYQFKIAESNNLTLITMDKDFNKVNNLIHIQNI